MRLFHLSDLHIGKQLHQYNMAESQAQILEQIIEQIKEYRPDAVMIAGDVFDRSAPSGEAYELFDDFLNKVASIEPTIPVMIIAGNHDSAKRLHYASGFLEKSSIFIETMPPVQEEDHIKKIILEDAHGEVCFYLLPFLKPGFVRHLFPEGEITDYGSAVKGLLQRECIDFSKRNVLISHQFYIFDKEEPERSDSEQLMISVGGLDSIDAGLVMAFDYVALGHIHRPQKIGSSKIRYCGTPLKYSVSEASHEKSITMVTLGEKGAEAIIETIPLTADLDVRSEQGTLEEILSRATKKNCHDYISVTLTDENEIYRPKDQLEEVYDHLLEVKIENSHTRKYLQNSESNIVSYDPATVFKSFYETILQCPISSDEEKLMQEVIHIASEEGGEE